MMRNYTEEEMKLHEKLNNDIGLSEKERQKIKERLKEIYEKETKDFPFCH